MISPLDVLAQHGQAVLFGDLVDKGVVDSGSGVLLDSLPLGVEAKEGVELVRWSELGSVAGNGAWMGIKDLAEIKAEVAEELGIVGGRLVGELEHEGAGLGRPHERLGNPLDHLQEPLIVS